MNMVIFTSCCQQWSLSDLSYKHCGNSNYRNRLLLLLSVYLDLPVVDNIIMEFLRHYAMSKYYHRGSLTVRVCRKPCRLHSLPFTA